MAAKKKQGKRCPDCGRKMKQQFIGLVHCKCGTSWMKETGFFRRKPGMVFCFDGKPYIRYDEQQ